MRAFAPSSTFQLPDGEHNGIAFVGALCRNLPCMQIELSCAAAEIADAIRSLLEHELS